jgi:hypothetical protein
MQATQALRWDTFERIQEARVVKTRRFRLIVVVVALSLAGVSCRSQYIGAVRSAASPDLRCPEEQIAVTPVDDTEHAHLTTRTYYRAEGCGASGTYVCEGWNNWDQTPICGEGHAPK